MTDSRSDVADSANIEIVRRFCEAWSDLDLDLIMAFFTEDAVFHNIPVDPAQGKEAIRATIAGYTDGVQKVEERILHILGDGQVVMTERIVVFSYPGATIELPVMGIFELRDGLVSSWRDYFDMNQFTSQLPTPPPG